MIIKYIILYPNEFSCESACYIDEPCQHYKYKKETETCTLYDDNFEMNYCNQIMGPPDDSWKTPPGNSW